MQSRLGLSVAAGVAVAVTLGLAAINWSRARGGTFLVAAAERPAVRAGATRVAHPWPEAGVPLKTETEGRAEGERDARVDIAAGVLGWRMLGGWGLQDPVSYRIVGEGDVLERDFGIDVQLTRAGSGCTPPPDEPYLRARVNAYNALMKPLIVAKHGEAVFSTASQRAAGETAANKRESEKNEADCRSGKGPDCGKGCDPPWYESKDGFRLYKPGCSPHATEF